MMSLNNESSPDKRRIIVVLGMHRGGTSAVTRALSSLGIPLGENLHAARYDNPKGFFEDRDCHAINEELLRHLNSAYDQLALSPFADGDPVVSALKLRAAEVLNRKIAALHGCWAFKDPRTARLLGFWRQVIASCDLEVGYVIASRNPLSVALSLNHRDQISPEKSYFLWLQHMVPAVLETAGCRRVVVDYDDLILDPRTQLLRIAKSLGLEDRAINEEALSEFTDGFLDPALRHSQFSTANLSLDDRVPADVAAVFELLARAAKDQINIEDSSIAHAFEHASANLRSCSSIFEYLRSLEHDLVASHIAKETQTNELVSEYARQVESISRRLLDKETQTSDLAQQVHELSRSVLEKSELIQALNKNGANQDEQIRLLIRTAKEREDRIFALERTATDRESQVASLSFSMAERDRQVSALTDQLSTLNQQLASYQWRASELEAWNADLKASLSWRITSPLRSVLDVILRLSKREQIEASTQKLEVPPAANPAPPVAPSRAEYVDDTPPPPGFYSDLRPIAFYLPQFHPIPENDAAWGTGFTEWFNVAKAKPEFEGHYQPHLPAELGFYDLRIKDVQARQVELARRYGIGAFCFYFYWFGGKTLLELPVRQYLNSPELNLPFCLCWANENWTREWNGLDNEVIIGQNHSPEDDIAFIEHVGQYMHDPRYLTINGRPVLLVYQPSLLPNARETAGRWRSWARKNGFGDLYLIGTHSLETRHPADFGFDAATEFPPNLTGPPIVTGTVRPYNPKFTATVYDWSALVERSRAYTDPGYKLFRGVCPSWDNSPRRPGRGGIFINSSPEGFQEWLSNAAKDTRARLAGEERLVFINAWNEWAEGAHLEPDQRYGYAWLSAARQALMTSRFDGVQPRARVVVVTHDTHLNGAPHTALNLTRELVESLRCEVEVISLGPGPLQEKFEKYAKLHNLSSMDVRGPAAQALAQQLYRRGFELALVNSTVSGHFLVTLKEAGLRCIALVHELKELMLSYKLETHARALAQHADLVVFGAPAVQDSFLGFAAPDAAKIIIRPQGVLKEKVHYEFDKASARTKLRLRLGLAQDTAIVLAVGYGDFRKGIDFFVEAAALLRERAPDVHFVWVGNLARSHEIQINKLMAEDPEVFERVHFAGYQSDPSLFYAGADIYALTSREDPFPSVVLEAMAAGLPVVAFSGSGGSNSLIEEGVGRNVPMGDCQAFADTLLHLLREPALREGMGRRGLELISERFSFRKYAFDLLQLGGAPIRKISVVIPNYNYAQFLPHRLSTILNQTYPIYEIVFLDDGSSDASLVIAHRILSRSNIDHRIIANERNSGSVFQQWKRGAELAQGELIWIAEADDLSAPEFLATVVAGFEDPNVVLSYCESKQIDETGRILANDYQDYVADLGRERWQQQYVCEGEHEIRNYLCVKNTIPNVSAVLMRRDALIEALRQSADASVSRFRVAGDWNTYLHVLANGRLAFFPQSLNSHRRHGGGVTLGSFDTSHYREIEETQNWVASRYPLSTYAKLSARSYLRSLREQFGLEDEGRIQGEEEPTATAEASSTTEFLLRFRIPKS